MKGHTRLLGVKAIAHMVVPKLASPKPQTQLLGASHLYLLSAVHSVTNACWGADMGSSQDLPMYTYTYIGLKSVLS